MSDSGHPQNGQLLAFVMILTFPVFNYKSIVSLVIAQGGLRCEENFCEIMGCSYFDGVRFESPPLKVKAWYCTERPFITLILSPISFGCEKNF